MFNLFMRFLILFSLIFIGSAVFAIERDFMAWAKGTETEQIPLEKNMPYQGNNCDDAILKRILSVPEPLKPYLYPMLFESFSPFSKKILTHPEIEPFRNKIPELSKEFLQKGSKKTLEFLPPIYYPFFAPEPIRKQIFIFLKG